jgi:hypothetical protein
MTLLGVCPVRADLVFDHGYNTFNSSYPGEVWVINDAILDVLGGDMIQLGTLDFARANLYSGDIDWLWIEGNSAVNIHGGDIQWLAAFDYSSVYLYAYDVTYHPTGGGDYGDRTWVEGTYFRNDDSFRFLLGSTGDYSHINVVPEPATLSLPCLGSLLARRRK